MDTLSLLPLLTLTKQTTKTVTKTVTLMLLALLIICSLASPIITAAYAGLGGYMSEQLLGTGASSSLYLGDSANGPVVLGSTPTVTTLPANHVSITNTGTKADLRGNLTNLGGMPQADTWFVWGYSAGSMPYSTPVVSVTATGIRTVTLTDFNSERTVFYQFRAEQDVGASGATQSFKISGGGMGGWLLKNILPIIIGIGMFIALLALFKNPIAAFIATIIAMLAIAIVYTIINSM